MIDVLRAEASAPAPIPDGGWPEGAPAHELSRSPVAARIGRYAADAGLFLFHYEHAAHRELPDDWVPLDRADLGDPPVWEGGVLAERKYQGFRHDQAIGGFHPGQRAKWTAHELCHGLVGSAWRPDASRFFLATSARLAELLPVAVWYFFDEAFLTRCPAHADAPALFRTHCPACERAAAVRPDDPDAGMRIADGRRFIERELAAIARTRATGRPVSHGWSSIDLCGDGLAYAGAHGLRLHSDTFCRFAEAFLVSGGGIVDDLDALEARVVAVAEALLGGPSPAPLAPSRAHGRARWRLQDVGWRLAAIAHDTSGDAADALWAAIERLAGAVGATRSAGGDPGAASEAAISRAIAEYAALHAEYDLPSTELAFAVGFALPGGLGSARGSLAAGIASVAPLSSAILDDPDSEVAAFAAADLAAPGRAPLGERWAMWLADRGAVGDLARYEAALAGCAAEDVVATALGPDATPMVRLAEGARVLRFDVDVVAMAEAIESDGAPDPEERRCALVVGRSGSDVYVLDVTLATAMALESLGDGARWPGDAAEGRALREVGALVPARWQERR